MPYSHDYSTGDLLTVSECGTTTVFGDDDAEVRVSVRTSLPRASRASSRTARRRPDLPRSSCPRSTDWRTPRPRCNSRASWNPGTCASTCVPARAVPSHGIPVESDAMRSRWFAAECRRTRPHYSPKHAHARPPDYILMTFSSRRVLRWSTRIVMKTTGFCKLSLYPLFREERCAPRDTTLMRNQLTTFTISFWNPDMRTPYSFHGCILIQPRLSVRRPGCVRWVCPVGDEKNTFP